jgi:DNA-binding MarR family transcriptional regulator
MVTILSMAQTCDERDAAWALFLRTHSTLIEVLETELQREGRLPLAWFDVLVQLSAAPQSRMRMQDLADSILLSKSGVTRLIDRMQQAGLIQRRDCESDRRVVYAAITPKGRAAYRRAAPIAFRGVEEHFTRRLSARERRLLKDAFERLLHPHRTAETKSAAG